MSLTSADIKSFAHAQGFQACRVLEVEAPRYGNYFAQAQDRLADMDYLRRSMPTRLHPQSIIPTPQSLVVLSMRYPLNTQGERFAITKLPKRLSEDRRFGHIARYAWGGRDYHKIIQPKLIAIDQFVRTRTGRVQPAKAWVDSGPVLERDFAETAGIGFIGKNTCAIHSDWGSWFFIATLWLPERLEYDAPTTWQLTPIKTVHWGQNPLQQSARIGSCGHCTRCLDRCPTQALSAYQMDARRCISYWTIEAKSAPPPSLSQHFGRWIFGCDDCQTICPWNREVHTEEPTTQDWQDFAYPQGPLLRLRDGFDPRHPYWLDDAEFLKQFAGTPIMRAGRLKMRANVERLLAQND